MAQVWLTADLHMGHSNVIKYSKRPFSSVEEMDETLISNWNSVVRPGDTVYVLGDFSFHKTERSISIFKRLVGEKFLIRGNHDRDEKVVRLFGWAKDLYTVKVPDPDVGVQRIVLCHYCLRVWDKRHYGAFHCHGHSHGSLPDDPMSKALDVGVDCHGYFPISYEQVKELMTSKGNGPVDHHQAEHDEGNE